MTRRFARQEFAAGLAALGAVLRVIFASVGGLAHRRIRAAIVNDLSLSRRCGHMPDSVHARS